MIFIPFDFEFFYLLLNSGSSVIWSFTRLGFCWGFVWLYRKLRKWRRNWSFLNYHFFFLGKRKELTNLLEWRFWFLNVPVCETWINLISISFLLYIPSNQTEIFKLVVFVELAIYEPWVYTSKLGSCFLASLWMNGVLLCCRHAKCGLRCNIDCSIVGFIRV